MLVASCTGGADAPESAEAGDPASFAVTDEDIEDLAYVVAISVEPAVVAPGDRMTVTIEGYAPGGSVHVRHGDHEVSADLVESQTTLTVPGDAPDGLHRVWVEHAGAVLAIDQVRVASEPGIWVQADRRHVGPDDVFTLSVTASGVPLDWPAMLVAPPEVADWEDDFGRWEDEWDDEDWEDWEDGGWEDWEEGEEDWADWDSDFADEGMAMFRLHDSGWLVPIGPTQAASGQVPALADLIDRPIAVPGHLADLGGFRVLATPGSGDASAALWSDAATLVACGEPGAVSGQVAGPSIVRAVSIDGPPRVATVEADGPYLLEAGPGRVVVTVLRIEDNGGEQPEPTVVDVPCGDTVVAGGSGAAGVQSASWQPAVPVSAGGSGDRFCRGAYVVGRALRGDEHVAEQLAEGVAARFANTLHRLHVVTPQAVRDLLAIEAQQQLLGDEDGDLSGIGEMLDVDFLVIVNSGTLGRNYTMGVVVFRLRDLVNVAHTREESRNLAHLAFRAPSVLEAAAATQRAEICAEVTPAELALAPGETGELTVRVTDVAGEGADGAIVEITPDPECGDLLPEAAERRIDDDTLVLTFEATARDVEECVDELRVEATWRDGRPPVVSDVSLPYTVVRVGGRFTVEMSMSIDPEAVLDAVPVFLAFDAEFEARNCDGGGIAGPWEGELHVGGGFLGPFIGGEDFEGTIPTAFALPPDGGRFSAPGMDELGLTPYYYAGGDVLAFHSGGYPWMVGDIKSLDEGAPC